MPSEQVVVIGSGIAGASTAFALARRGLAVTVVDAGESGQATAASAGIIAPWMSSAEESFYELYCAGAAYYPVVLDQLAEVGITRTDYRKTGALLVNADPGVLAEAEERTRARALLEPGIVGSVERIDNAQVRELFPPLGPDLAGVFISGGGRVDGRTMRDALLAGVEHYGGKRVQGRVSLVRSAGERVSVLVDGEALGADSVVAAAGAWTPALLEPLGVGLAVNPQRGQITHLRLDGFDTSGWPSVHPLSHHYMVAFDESRIAVGATRETGSGFDVRVTAAGQKQVLDDALSIAPGLADATLIETRVGLRPYPDGQLPFVGAAAGFEGLYINAGFGASGLTMAPFTGDALARRMLNEPEEFDLAPFDANR